MRLEMGERAHVIVDRRVAFTPESEPAQRQIDMLGKYAL